MNHDDLSEWGTRAGSWAADYYRELSSRPVCPLVIPGSVCSSVPSSPPESGEEMATIFSDFERIIVPNMTHWQHPRFLAYFPANNSPPSVLAEWLTATLGAQCMLWQTSPAATELEKVMVDWLRQMIGLGDGWKGLIQSGASLATLSFVIVARDKVTDWDAKELGLFGHKPMRVYTSVHAHSSIEKAVFLAGLGRKNLVLIDTDEDGSMDAGKLKAAIQKDREDGLCPIGVIASLGTTSVGVSDSLWKVLPVAKEEGLMTHVDAAWAGSALICPEVRHIARGLELADSVTFNPHKWLMTNFDCTVHLIRNPNNFQRTMQIQPAFLRTHDKEVTDLSSMSIELGRRFRALKLWFVVRSYGVEELRKIIRNHMRWSTELAGKLERTEGFELITKPSLALFTFRIKPKTAVDNEKIDQMNEKLVKEVNKDGTTYITQTTYQSKYVIRVSIGATLTTEKDINICYDKLVSIGKRILDEDA